MVKNKYKTTKDLEEAEAKEILIKISPTIYKNLVKSESPDYILSKNKVGVEMTSAILQSTRKRETILGEIFNLFNETGIINQNKINILRELGITISYFPKSKYVVASSECKSYNPHEFNEEEFSSLLKIINKKLKKLPKYKKCDNYELFVKHRFYFFESQEKELYDKISKVNNNYKMSFKIIYLYLENLNILYQFNFENESISKFDLSRNKKPK